MKIADFARVLSAAGRQERATGRAAEQAAALARALPAGEVPARALTAYYDAAFPGPDTDVRELRLLAIDLETTGLDPERDHVLSVGFVPVNGLVIDLSGAFHQVISSTVEVGQSATVHGLTDDAVAAGETLEAILPAVVQALTGRLLLAHFARLEATFLSAACTGAYGVPLVTSTVDTLEIQRRIVATPYGDPPAGLLRLPAAREHFHLPRYRGHQALTDALACAELYLAQVAHLTRNGPTTLAGLRR